LATKLQIYRKEEEEKQQEEEEEQEEQEEEEDKKISVSQGQSTSPVLLRGDDLLRKFHGNSKFS